MGLARTNGYKGNALAVSVGVVDSRAESVRRIGRISRLTYFSIQVNRALIRAIPDGMYTQKSINPTSRITKIRCQIYLDYQLIFFVGLGGVVLFHLTNNPQECYR